jgi:hypothetical protein
MVVEITGTITAARIMECEQVEKLYVVYNNTTGGFAVTFQPTGGSGVSIANGETALLYCNGTNIVNAVTSVGGVALVDLSSAQTLTNKTFDNVTVQGSIIHDGDTNNKIDFGTDTQDFQTGGSSRLDISDSGVRLGGTGTRVTGIIDDDTMGTASATNLSTAEAIKAYVDNTADSLIESGTVMLFDQTTAPTGWTKLTDLNDRALRVVDGTASTGGATPFTSVFGSGKTTASHTLTIAQIPAHTHTYDRMDTAPVNININNGTGTNRSSQNTGSAGGGGGHTHGLTMDLQYIDVIRATKI